MVGAPHVRGQDVREQRDHEVGHGKPPVHSRFKNGQSGNPRGPCPKNLAAPLVEALNENVVATIDGERLDRARRKEATGLADRLLATGKDCAAGLEDVPIRRSR